jgi:hypothetical protein
MQDLDIYTLNVPIGQSVTQPPVISYLPTGQEPLQSKPLKLYSQLHKPLKQIPLYEQKLGQEGRSRLQKPLISSGHLIPCITVLSISMYGF